MSTPAKKPNGKKATRQAIVCPHADECAAPAMHAEVMTSLDELRQAVGLLLEKSDEHGGRILALQGRVHDVSQRQIVADLREVKWLEMLGEIAARRPAPREER